MSTDLVLPGSVTETALELPPGLPYEEWEQAMVVLGRIARASGWWIGDGINYGEHEYGEKYSQALDVFGLDYGTLRNYAWVSSRVPLSRRRDKLSFSHHQEIAALEPLRQDGWLEEAAVEGWSKSELRKQIKNGGAPSDEPERCPTCGHRLPKGAQIRRSGK